MMLETALVSRGLEKLAVLDQVRHKIGYAHCDIFIDNIFVDDNVVFLGDLEYCRPRDDPAPAGLRRSSERAQTAEQLDIIQMEQLKDELSRI